MAKAATARKQKPPIELKPGDVRDITGDNDAAIDPSDGIESIQARDDFEQIALRRTITGLIGDDEALATVKVYRRDPAKKSGGDFLVEFSPQEWNQRGEIRCIQDRYGKGEYEIRVYGEGETGYGLIARSSISCEEPFNPIKRDPETNMPIMQANDNAGIIAVIQSGNQQIAAMFSEGLRAIADAVKPTQTAPTMTELILSLEGLDRLRGGTKTAVDPLDQFSKFITLQKAIQGNAPAVLKGDGGLSDMAAMAMLAKEFLPAIRDAMNKNPPQQQPIQQQLNQPIPDNVTALHPQPVPLTPEQQQQKQEAMFMAMMVQRKLKSLIENARVNLNPAPIAESLMGEVPLDVIDEWTAKTDAEYIEMLAQFNPDVKNFSEWFIRLKGDMAKLTNEPDEGNTASS